MTDSMFDEKGLRASGETDPEKTRRNEDAADVEGHRLAYEQKKAAEAGRMAARDDDESPDVEGHMRVAGPEEKAEAGKFLNEDAGEDEGEGVRPAR